MPKNLLQTPKKVVFFMLEVLKIALIKSSYFQNQQFTMRTILKYTFKTFDDNNSLLNKNMKSFFIFILLIFHFCLQHLT